MRTITDDEFLRSPQLLLDESHRSSATLVTANGRATLMSVPLENGVPVQAALLDLAATLFDQELISLGKAARIAGLSYSEMIDELGRRNIATIRLAPGELERELAALGP